VILVEAVKQVYALPRGKRVRRYLPRLKPALRPQTAFAPGPSGLHLGGSLPMKGEPEGV
jgi:hypothetical protein